jgi:uncharacterized protein (TIGR00730 family)
MLFMPSKKEKQTHEILGKKDESMQTCRMPLGANEQSNEPTQLHQITWRIFRIMSEFVDGFQFLSENKNEVTFWGSARLKPSSKWYKVAVEIGEMLGSCGFSIITGGGGGIMEAGNKGAKKAGAKSIGLNIELPFEQHVNKYVTSGRTFHYFFTRKVMMAASAQAYVFFPGGFGTLDEFFEILTLIQTKKMAKVPIVCVGHEFWDGLFEWSASVQRDKLKTISKNDLKLVTVVDTAKEAFDIVSKSKERSFF